MKHLKNLNLIILLAGMILAGCGLPMPANGAPDAHLAAGEGRQDRPVPTASATPVPTQTAIPSTATPQPSPSPTPRKLDPEKLALSAADLGEGFEPVDEATRQSMSLTPELLARSFEGIFRQARPVGSFGWIQPDPKKYQVVTGAVFYPLNQAEISAFDQALSDPTAAMIRFSQSYGGQAQELTSVLKVGDRSVAWNFLNTSGQITFKGEMIIARQRDAVILLMTIYLSDQKTPLSLATLAPLFADRLNQELP